MSRRTLVVGLAMATTITGLTVPGAAAEQATVKFPSSNFPLGARSAPTKTMTSVTSGIDLYDVKAGSSTDGYTVTVLLPNGRDAGTREAAETTLAAVEAAGEVAGIQRLERPQVADAPRAGALHGARGPVVVQAARQGRQGGREAQEGRPEGQGRLPGRRRTQDHRPVARQGAHGRRPHLPRLVRGLARHQRGQARDGLVDGQAGRRGRGRQRRLLQHPHRQAAARRAGGRLRGRGQAAQRGGPGPLRDRAARPYRPHHRADDHDHGRLPGRRQAPDRRRQPRGGRRRARPLHRGVRRQDPRRRRHRRGHRRQRPGGGGPHPRRRGAEGQAGAPRRRRGGHVAQRAPLGRLDRQGRHQGARPAQEEEPSAHPPTCTSCRAAWAWSATGAPRSPPGATATTRST
ncbi:hypothetical protein ACFSTC_44875 [Nonomuraea ferruginea]